MTTARHPRQPLVLIDGVVRFKGNVIVKRLFNENWIDLNKIVLWNVPAEDKEQFWQLLGYSASAYGELSFIRQSVVASVDAEAERLLRRARKMTRDRRCLRCGKEQTKVRR